jgi:hypothetical protein
MIAVRGRVDQHEKALALAGYGIGIATGPASGIFVLDVDNSGDKPGDDTLARLLSPGVGK